MLNSKEFKLIKWYPNFGLFENKYGIRECFSDFDLGRIEKTMKESEGKWKI